MICLGGSRISALMMLDEKYCCDENALLWGGTAAVFYDALLLLNTPEHLPMWKVFVVRDTINGEKTVSIVFA